MTMENWINAIDAGGSALAGLATLLVVWVAGRLTQNQARSTELQKVRLDYYRLLAPNLNRIMCYVTFIGRWKDFSPDEIVRMKRDLDETFFCAAPLFSREASEAYRTFIGLCFVTFNDWGTDARILSSAYRRRQGWEFAGGKWEERWDGMFEMEDFDSITANQLTEVRRSYDALAAVLVKDLDLNRARIQYTTDEVSLNAFDPTRTSIPGKKHS